MDKQKLIKYSLAIIFACVILAIMLKNCTGCSKIESAPNQFMTAANQDGAKGKPHLKNVDVYGAPGISCGRVKHKWLRDDIRKTEHQPPLLIALETL